VREHVTIHRGSVGGHGLTSVGADCMVMAVAHIAHDCTLGDRVLLANNVMLGGHVEIGDTVFVGGGTAIHQFVRIGRQAVIGGMSGVEADVVPFGSAMGNRARMVGLNLIGMKRRGFAREQIHALRNAFRMLFRDPGVFEERLAEVERRFAEDANVAEMLGFIRGPSRRGLCRAGRAVPEEESAEDEEAAA
jgi:UDP-N-acetylglucosamine acyltransferase